MLYVTWDAQQEIYLRKLNLESEIESILLLLICFEFIFSLSFRNFLNILNFVRNFKQVYSGKAECQNKMYEKQMRFFYQKASVQHVFDALIKSFKGKFVVNKHDLAFHFENEKHIYRCWTHNQCSLRMLLNQFGICQFAVVCRELQQML